MGELKAVPGLGNCSVDMTAPGTERRYERSVDIHGLDSLSALRYKGQKRTCGRPHGLESAG